ncbi:MAG TPA: enoyl-CoA hydratase-related protein [Candidatus Binatia bacterium]|nr:enoyl-CoA hydratase-related protein [Candidatus Binatia bacterium]
MIDLRRSGPVFVLAMDAGENRFNGDFIAAMNRALDEVERAGSPAALVTTGAGKFYSNGLDLDWMIAQGSAGARRALHDALAVLARVLTLPVYTVAAVNGHAFGAGAQLAVAHDLRLMRADRGFFCMPEIDMKVQLHPGMVAILQARLPLATAHEVIVTGTRYGGEAARAAGIVERALPEADLVPAAVEAAAAMAAKADPAMAKLKASLYPQVLAALASMPDDVFGG